MIMPDPSSLSDSVWVATQGPFDGYPPLDGDLDADVVVVGAGFTGLSCALNLAEKGYAPVVLEAQQPGWGGSGRNGGQVVAGLKEDPDSIEAAFGPEMGPRAVALSSDAPGMVFDLCRRHGIDCDLRDTGWIQPAHTARAAARQGPKIEQWQRRGMDVVSLTAGETAAMIGTDAYVGGLLDRRGGTVHPLNFVHGLARAATGAGARIHGETPVIGWQAAADGYTIQTESGKLRCRVLVLCTNAYTSAGPLARTVAPVYSLQVATEPLSENVRATILPGGQAASDTRRLLNYFRLDRDGRLVMGGRGAYGEGARRKRHMALRKTAATIFPQLGEIQWAHAWGGLVAMTDDHYPHLHEPAPGLFAALGYNGRGVAMSVALGAVLADRVGGAEAHDLRWPITSMQPIRMRRFLKPGATVVTEWNRWLDRFNR
jgi:glycine/D-amino acid oxidase-like deaminating enzyme